MQPIPLSGGSFISLAWFIATLALITAAPSHGATPADKAQRASRVLAAIASKIIFPKVEFREATLGEIVDDIAARSREYDPEKKGINLVLQEREKLADTKITLSLNEIPLSDLLRYIAELGHAKLQAGASGYAFAPRGSTTSHVDALAPKHASAAMKQAEAILIPKLEFRDVTLHEAVYFLNLNNLEIEDPLPTRRRHVNAIIFDGPAVARFSLELSNVSFAEALRRSARLAGYELTGDDHALFLRPAAK